VLLQTLRTHDFDELAQAFPQWDLRFRQLGRGPFRGQLQFLQLGWIQVYRSMLRALLERTLLAREPGRSRSKCSLHTG
jgi:hypothetical protein